MVLSCVLGDYVEREGEVGSEREKERGEESERGEGGKVGCWSDCQ